MSKKQKTYIGILVILVIAFLITKIDNNVEKRIQFFQADSAKIASIEISNIKDTLKISKLNGIWKIVSPFEKEANEYQIQNIFTKVLNVKASNLPISENEDSFNTYRVTSSQGTLLRFLDKNDNMLDEVIVGKSSSSKTTPVRRPNENKIFKLEENINYIVTTNTDDWREKTILEIEDYNISKISVLSEISAYELTPSDSVWNYADGKSSLIVSLNNKALLDVLTKLTQLKVNGFVNYEYEVYKEKLAMPSIEIGIEILDGSNHYVRLAMDKDPKYVMQLDNNEEFLYSVYQDWVDIFTKEAMDFK
ncbi:MAG: DUF4340 domain-containing protein [Candidatus Cloacimonetes bacterium]|nr:DUF4340 domain-containing protein [Candidatus Cloacimonadota bacterium]MBT4575371.1 DUF4340 domain-containing protein [Candidatus Cloacimonadota bacterium]